MTIDRGAWPDNDIRRAFVDGVAWWEWTSRHATLWPSDREQAEAEAVRRYGDPEVVDSATAEAPRGEGGE